MKIKLVIIILLFYAIWPGRLRWCLRSTILLECLSKSKLFWHYMLKVLIEMS